jgi:hypothetical protein
MTFRQNPTNPDSGNLAGIWHKWPLVVFRRCDFVRISQMSENIFRKIIFFEK